MARKPRIAILCHGHGFNPDQIVLNRWYELAMWPRLCYTIAIYFVFEVASRMKLLWAISPVLLAACYASTCLAVPTYRIETLGLVDAEHTRADGYLASQVGQANDSGQILGRSNRYSGSTYLGQDVWLYNGGSLTPVGLIGAEHTSSGGLRNIQDGGMNQAGYVVGTSERFSGNNSMGHSAWLYNGEVTINIGLTGIEYTRNDGYKESVIRSLNEAGKVLGTSFRFSGGDSLGSVAWIYNGSSTSIIGLVDNEHSRVDGYRNASFSFSSLPLNGAGQVSGHSQRFNGGSTNLGQSSWFYNGLATIKVGLRGTEHTRSDGYKFSRTIAMSKTGELLGYSERFNGGSADMGRSVWVFNGTDTINIGLTGVEYTRNDGRQYSEADNIVNQSGQVIGYSQRYNGDTFLGRSIWLYDGTATKIIGLSDAEHTRNNGFRYGAAEELNGAGQVRGHSYRYSGGTELLGRSAWLYNGSNTLDIGLADNEHTFSDGAKYSDTLRLNETGQVLGYSYRRDYSGQTVWLFNGVSTTKIGLTDTEHTQSDGYKFSEATQLDENGQVRGHSKRFNGLYTDMGQSAWLFSGLTTTNIGLTSSEYTRADGYRYSEHELTNEIGQMTGFSRRYNGSAQVGQDAWFYDSELKQTFTLQLSTRSDGLAYSDINHLGQDGLVLGTYSLFDEFDNDLGQRAFYFTVADGMHDLGELVDGGLSTNGWGFLASAVRTNGQDLLLGQGKLLSQSSGQIAFLLIPITADFNNDGNVDGRDFLAWQRGESPRPLSAEDLALWQEQYNGGNTLSAANQVAAVPEPSSLALVLCSLLLAARVRVR